MNIKPRKPCTAEFKAQAVELIRTEKPVSQFEAKKPYLN